MAGITVPTDAYVTLEDVRTLLPNRTYDANSKPTMEQAEQILKDVALRLNGILRGLGYATPLTGTDDKALLASFNRLGGAALIEQSTKAVTGVVSAVGELYQAQFEAIIKDLGAGKYKFLSAGTPPALTPDGPDDLDTGGDRDEPIFKISTEDMEHKF